MSDDSRDVGEPVSPSAFMRRLRPELYSDTASRTTYQLDAPTLEYHLETVTARNQTHEFEIFCRKLCERAICPNLRPATGPEGGGDSKVDTETIAIADEISALTYVGSANAGRERWGFAFSAKRSWAQKVRSDVAGIVATGRNYHRIYCVTARFARAKDRARVEDELTKQHGLPVTILDRAWIVEQVIDSDRKDLAFHYLRVGQEVQDSGRLGPADYSRAQQLDDLERELVNPQAFAGMEMQRATEALVAAKLSRSLERPRTETDGRFARAVRLAEADGTYRQRLEADYEWIWTAFWWYDDIALLNSSYDAFETLVLETEHAKNLEFLCNLAQNLFTSVLHGHLTADDARLPERVTRLSERLQTMVADVQRPNNALEARTSLLVIEVNQAILQREPDALAALWPLFSEVLRQAEGLGEYPAERLIKLIEVFGHVAGSEPGYARLVDEVASFVSKRTSEAQGALVLLKRAEQLGPGDHIEMIRLLGKAGRQLTKKEYAGSLIDAMWLLSLAYRGAGMLWAARASCLFAISSIIIEAEEDGEVPVSIVPMLTLLGWISIELRHLPDTLEAARLLRGCAAGLPLDDEAKDRVAKHFQEIDLILGSHILNFTPSELDLAGGLPDVLERLGLYQSRTSLLYALGHESVLREDGSIPNGEPSERVAELFALLASQPVSDNLRGTVIFNEPGLQGYLSLVLGIRIEVRHQGTAASVLVAEAVVGAIEALFATSLDLDSQPHTERFVITIEERTRATRPSFRVDEERMTATVRWPAGEFPAAHGNQGWAQKVLMRLAASVFAATCLVEDMKAIVKRFVEDEGVLDRIAMIAVVGTSRQRTFTDSVSRLSDWTKLAHSTFTLQSTRPKIVRRKLEPLENARKQHDASERDGDEPPPVKDHRDLSVRSVIDIHLWNRAGWTGIAFPRWGPRQPPAIALLFTDRDAAIKIFERWQERFGRVDSDDEIFIAIVRGISVEQPAHYNMLITSRLRPDSDFSGAQRLMFTSRIQTMNAESDANLNGFLDAYSRSGCYLLVPAIHTGEGHPELLTPLAILKRGLSVKAASDVREEDIEVIGLGPRRRREKRVETQ